MSRTYRLNDCYFWYNEGSGYKYVWDTYASKNTEYYRKGKVFRRRRIRAFQKQALRRFNEYVLFPKSTWYN